LPRPLNPREFVNLTVWSKLDDSNLICCSFPTNSDPPSDEFTATKGVIRGEFTWVVLLEALEGETQCKLTFWVHADVKTSIPRVLFSSVLLQSNLKLVERVLWRFARDVEVDRQSFKAWQAKLELEHDEQVQATLVLYQMKFSKRYRRKSSATKLTLFHSILLIACFALASLKMRLASLGADSSLMSPEESGNSDDVPSAKTENTPKANFLSSTFRKKKLSPSKVPLALTPKSAKRKTNDLNSINKEMNVLKFSDDEKATLGKGIMLKVSELSAG